jgi:hypothetical protein
MTRRHHPGRTSKRPADQAIRDQEVLRANRELSAYFKGRRTEREARAALKTIKAFIRERERMEPKNRSALPGLESARRRDKISSRESRGSGLRRARTSRRAPQRAPKLAAVPPPPAKPAAPESSEPDDGSR